MISGAMLLKCPCTWESPGNHANADSGLVDPGCDLRLCTSNKLPNDAGSTGS